MGIRVICLSRWNQKLTAVVEELREEPVIEVV